MAQSTASQIDEDDARHTLQTLRGRVHQVHTGIAVCHNGRTRTTVTTADITMRDYTDAEIDAYIASGDPFDKAGSYAVQHPLFQPVRSYSGGPAINGCYAAIVGLVRL